MGIITDFFCRAAALAVVTALNAAPVAASAAATPDRYDVVYGARVKLSVPAASELALRIGRPDTLEQLVSRLLAVAEEFTGQPRGIRSPRVTLMTLGELQRRLCGGPCSVRAAYVPGDGLLIDRDMRPDVNEYHQSILFHELVHHVQDVRGIYSALGSCRRWQRRETDAYALQNRFLAALGARIQVVDAGSPCGSNVSRPAQAFGSSGE